ncbi:DUF1152 domain-containing protein [Pseudonocardia hispaniensis]|uniref:DUF1152 domain-containing protein n=1 Tax=Pseudonocardia hispaniensis TaxID=904933 RepID=A0ABW1J0M4_9PSEU
MRTLIVAAGGGGDAITSAALVRPLRLADPPVVMTYSWDRLMVDPLPGPRTAKDFTGLHELAPSVLEIVASTRPVAPAGSSLPYLAADLPARLLLLDPAHGAAGLADQISAAAAHFQVDHIALVDVGGDALTTGHDPGLRSPLADQLALAACLRTGLPTRLVIAGPGLDGEVSCEALAERLAQLDAQSLPSLTAADIRRVRHVFTWHPSEASGLLAAAASGLRGRVEVRDAGDQVELTTATTDLRVVDAKRASTLTPARHLEHTTSLDEAEQIIRNVTGISEIAYETRKADRLGRRHARHPDVADLAQVDRHAAEARQRDADYISVRRLSELLGATSLDAFAALSAMLAARRPHAYESSVYRTTAAP